MTKRQAYAAGYQIERIAIPNGRARTRARYFWLTPRGLRIGPYDNEAEALSWLEAEVQARARQAKRSIGNGSPRG